MKICGKDRIRSSNPSRTFSANADNSFKLGFCGSTAARGCYLGGHSVRIKSSLTWADPFILRRHHHRYSTQGV